MYLLVFVAGFISAIIFLLVSSEWRRKRRRKKRNSTEERSGYNLKKSRKKVKIDTYVKAATSIVYRHKLHNEHFREEQIKFLSSVKCRTCQ